MTLYPFSHYALISVPVNLTILSYFEYNVCEPREIPRSNLWRKDHVDDPYSNDQSRVLQNMY